MIASLLLLVAASSQKATSLAEYLVSHPSSGALLAIEPEEVKAEVQDPKLADFKRKAVTLGSLTAIVPTEMVVIDDTFKQQPNLYDGLPAEAKVLYLMTSLTEDQWRLARGDGIGMNDLQGEQRAVYTSLLPKPFKWKSWVVPEPGQSGQEGEKGVISDEKELALIRLRITRQPTFQVSLQGTRGYSNFDRTSDWGEPGTVRYDRDDTDEYGAGDFMGVVARQTLPNKLKVAQLEYKSSQLNALVRLPASSKASDVLTAISAATGLEIHADLRVADRTVTFKGDAGRARDLLQALALGVTGTYRRVGPAYVLTSDLVGLGQRKLRFSMWTTQLRNLAWKRESEWRLAVAKSGAIKNLKFDPKDPLSPTSTVLDKVMEADSKRSGPKFPFSQLSEAEQASVKRSAAMYSSQKWDLSEIGITSELKYGFVLPNGKRLHVETRMLGDVSMFPTGDEPTVQPQTPPVRLLNLSKSERHHALVIGSLDPDSLGRTVQMVADRGFGEIWVETTDARTLLRTVESAKSRDLKVRLLIEPFATDRGHATRDPDRNILGDVPHEWHLRVPEMMGERRIYAWVPAEPLVQPALFAPTDPALPSLHSELIRLVRTPGLSGAVVANTSPWGYQPSRSEGRSGFPSQEELEGRASGYSDTQRLTFLREHHIDPIDLASRALFMGPDLRQPFFLDDALRGERSIYDGRDVPNPELEKAFVTWDQYRAKLNLGVIEPFLANLAKSVPGLPLFVQERPLVQNPTSRNPMLLEPWSEGSPLPAMTDGPLLSGLGNLAMFYYVDPMSTLPWSLQPSFLARPDGLQVAFDLRSADGPALLKVLETRFGVVGGKE